MKITIYEHNDNTIELCVSIFSIYSQNEYMCFVPGIPITNDELTSIKELLDYRRVEYEIIEFMSGKTKVTEIIQKNYENLFTILSKAVNELI